MRLLAAADPAPQHCLELYLRGVGWPYCFPIQIFLFWTPSRDLNLLNGNANLMQQRMQTHKRGKMIAY
jgi:hypothetical protein